LEENSKPLIFSIVIPCYNRTLLLKRALLSCVQQSSDNFEVIVVDDGSEEDVESVVTSFSDDRIRYYRQNNKGVAVARNTGIDLAKGEWIAFLDSDDTFLPNKLEVVEAYIESESADMFISRADQDRGVEVVWATPQLDLSPQDDITEFMFSKYQLIPTSTFVVKTRLAKKIKFNDTLSLCEDIDFIVRVGGNNAHKITMIPDVLVVYDDAAESGRLSRVAYSDQLEGWLAASRNYFSDRGYFGYRASYLSKYTAKEKPIRAFTDLINGLIRGGVSFRLSLRRGLRAFFPRFYSFLVSQYLRIRSKLKATE
jgi:glycosyltransferase involved in cell wall biosynthesis